MKVNPNVFIHETDREAMQALKAIPGFSQVTKSFLNSWSEKMMYMENIASNIRITDEQLPKYKAMLKPICAKLGIEEPDLFLKLDVVPNAYTSGDTRPFIVMTTGLLDTIPEELIPTVLAHECGHIACHHVLYRTMGTMILNGALSLIPLGAIAIYPIMSAFANWMRCSELSADRAAVLCDGTPDKVVEMCMRFAGFNKKIAGEMNKDAFLAQAEEYKKLVKESTWNKTLEYMRFSQLTHPINAIRACECLDWAASEEYGKAVQCFAAWERSEIPAELPLSISPKSQNGREPEAVKKELEELGFRNVTMKASGNGSVFTREHTVLSVAVNDSSQFREGQWIRTDTPIEIRYYEKGREEVRTASGTVAMINSDRYYTGMDHDLAVKQLSHIGFTNIHTEPVSDIEEPGDPALGKVITITVGKNVIFRSGDTFPADIEIRILYHDMMKGTAR